MTAIETKYIGPSNTRGARIHASFMTTAPKGYKSSIFIDYPHELSGEACHRAAMLALLAANNISAVNNGATWHSGGTVRGYVFVRVIDSAEVKE